MLSFLPVSKTRTDKMKNITLSEQLKQYISRQCMYIVFILQCHVCKKMLNLELKI